jgi:hypothetical protein
MADQIAGVSKVLFASANTASQSVTPDGSPRKQDASCMKLNVVNFISIVLTFSHISSNGSEFIYKVPGVIVAYPYKLRNNPFAWNISEVISIKERRCADQISTISADAAAIENSLIDHRCHANITPLARSAISFQDEPKQERDDSQGHHAGYPDRDHPPEAFPDRGGFSLHQWYPCTPALPRKTQ